MSRKRSWLFFALVALVAGGMEAQESRYAGLEEREIKALSAEQVTQYLAGEGMGMALAAELNGYPGPKHVLDLAEKLGLSEEQKKAVQGAFDPMHARAVALGAQILELERRIDAAFAAGRAEPSTLRADLAELGRLLAELRFVHLDAHLQTQAILTASQLTQYATLRGYAGGQEHHHHAHGE